MSCLVGRLAGQGMRISSTKLLLPTVGHDSCHQPGRNGHSHLLPRTSSIPFTLRNTHCVKLMSTSDRRKLPTAQPSKTRGMIYTIDHVFKMYLGDTMKTVKKMCRFPLTQGVSSIRQHRCALQDMRPVEQIEYLEQLESRMLLQLFEHFSSDETLAQNITNEFIARLFEAELSVPEDLYIHLMFLSAIFKLKLTDSPYISKFITFLDRSGDEALTRETIRYLAFCVICCRSVPLTLLSRIEKFLSENIHHLELSDCCLFCMTCFMSQAPISHSLLDLIAEKILVSDLGDSSSILLLTNVLKSFRLSGYYRYSFYSKFATKLQEDVHMVSSLRNLNIVSNILTLFASLRIYQEKLCVAMATQTKHIVRSRGKTRSKDIANISLSLGRLRFDSDVYAVLEEALLAAGTIHSDEDLYGNNLLDALQGFVYVERFPHKLLDAAFTQNDKTDFSVAGKNNRMRQMLLLHYSVLLECPSYTGPQFSQEFVKKLWVAQVELGTMEWQWELTYRQNLIRSVQVLTGLLGEDCVQAYCVLPHMQTADIVLRLDAGNTPMAFTVDKHATDLPAPCDSREKRLAIEVVGASQLLRDSVVPTGHFSTKIRQLTKLGYDVKLVLPPESDKLDSMTDAEAKMFWKNKLAEYGVNIQQNASNSKESCSNL